jgi:acyl-CoA thioesterase
MADLKDDTEPIGQDGRYRAILSPAWEGLNGIPVGGYLAAIALRAAGKACGLPRPVSFYCQFVQSPKLGSEVQLEVTTLRATKRTAALRVSLLQSSELMLEALIWASADDMTGYDFNASEPPTASKPEDWQSIEGRTNQPLPRCMRQIETRWDHLDPGSPGAHGKAYSHAWHRFRPRDRYDDPFADASRLLLLSDIRAFGPVAFHVDVPAVQVPFFAPNIDLSVQFIRPSSHCGWLFGAARALAATQGTIATRIEFWSEQSEPLAIASSTLICRPNPFAG